MRLSRMRLVAVARKELIQLRRDLRSLILAFVLPILLLILFGYAITWDVDEIRLAVVDQDASRRAAASSMPSAAPGISPWLPPRHGAAICPPCSTAAGS